MVVTACAAEDEETAIGLQERPRVEHQMIGMDHASRKKLPLDLEGTTRPSTALGSTWRNAN